MTATTQATQARKIKTGTLHRSATFERAAVDAGVGTDFDIVADAHAAELFDLGPATGFRGKAEAVGADDRA